MVKRASIIVLFFLLSFFFFQIYLSTGEGDETVFQIERGEGFLQIAENLKEKGLVGSSYAFSAYIILTGKRGELKAGSYLLSPQMSVSRIAEKIVKGKTHQKKLTIIEGWNLNHIAEYLQEEGIGSKEEFYRLAGKPPHFEEPAKPGSMSDNGTLEGYLFPDTYYVSFHADMEEVIGMMMDNFEKRATEEWSEEVVTIASLIEKEVFLVEDKELVSGIIRRRMELGMPLQIDATITYLTGKRSTRVSIEETRINSPYNTYRYTGLPEGPIANPGLSSIEAALNPKDSEYLYYLSKPTGETVFSKTLVEHNIAKNKYLR